jgi:hypothetical protein
MKDLCELLIILDKAILGFGKKNAYLCQENIRGVEGVEVKEYLES